MFSPTQSNPASTVRRTRRRPLSNGNSAAQPKAKRQRLTDETFVPPDAPEMEEAKSHRASANRNEIFAPAPQQEIAVRPKKSRTGDRGNKGDGSIILVSFLSFVKNVAHAFEIFRPRMIHILSANLLRYLIVSKSTLQVHIFHLSSCNSILIM